MQLKSHKVNRQKAGKIDRAKGEGTHQTGGPKSSKGSLKKQRRINAEFQQRVNDLRERSIGSGRKKHHGAVPVLEIKPATFQVPSKNEMQLFTADELLKDEKVEPVATKPKKVSSRLAISNRFSHLENDEILEDGTHSILKMDVKPATFILPNQRQPSSDPLYDML